MADTINSKALNSGYHISANLQDYESARSSFFTFYVMDKEKLQSFAKASDAQGTTNIGEHAQEYLALNVLRCDVPHFNVEVLRFRRGNEEVKFAGVPTYNEGSLVVDDIVGLDTKGILMAWQAKTYDVHTHKGGRMADYKVNCLLTEYTQDFEAIRQWELVGCFISNISEDSFDRESDGKRKITATIQYDRALPQEIGVK